MKPKIQMIRKGGYWDSLSENKKEALIEAVNDCRKGKYIRLQNITNTFITDYLMVMCGCGDWYRMSRFTYKYDEGYCSKKECQRELNDKMKLWDRE